jgi:hypothetical protein
MTQDSDNTRKHGAKTTPRTRKAATGDKFVYRFKVTLKDIQPPIWRRIEVPAEYSFWDLHVAIQDSMGWYDCHLHEFKITNPINRATDKIGIPDDDYLDEEDIPLAGWETPIAMYFKKPGDKADYNYDFGDYWEHQVVLEDIVPRTPGTKYPLCLAGERACPPEDCGGVGGYEHLLHVLRTPRHKEHNSMLEWLGRNFDPEDFSPEKVHFDNPKERWKMAFQDNGL